MTNNYFISDLADLIEEHSDLDRHDAWDLARVLADCYEMRLRDPDAGTFRT